jgi:hypothetical protein
VVTEEVMVSAASDPLGILEGLTSGSVRDLLRHKIKDFLRCGKVRWRPRHIPGPLHSWQLIQPLLKALTAAPKSPPH